MKKVIKTDEEWQELLDHKQFMVTRRKFQEPPYSNEFALSEKNGMYACVCCGEPLFDSVSKFEHKCGWPCFICPTGPDSVTEVEEGNPGTQGIEVVCNCCDAYLGQLFTDGPAPTGLRYTINSLALSFEEREPAAVQQAEPVKTTEPKGWQPGEPAKKEGGCGSGSCGCN